MRVEEIPLDPTVSVAKDDIDEVHVETRDVEPTVPPSLSLCAMMEMFIITQATHGQLLDELISEVAVLRVIFLILGLRGIHSSCT